MKRKLIISILCCLLLLGCDSGSAGDPAGGYCFTDDLGRQVTVEAPRRVVCLTASFADIWCLAGGGDTLVGATSSAWTYFDIPTEGVADLGSAKEPDLERLIACQPDLILASCGSDGNRELETLFNEMGLTAAFFSVNDFDDYLRMLKICTDLTGCPENYERYGAAVQAQVKDALARADGSAPTVLYVRATGSSCKVKNSQGTVLGEMLADLGCVNIADREGSLLEQLSMEVILREDPDFIFIVVQGSDPSGAEAILEATLLKDPAWATLSAVREGRCHVLDQNLYNMKPNARWGEAYEQLADILYPAE